MLLGHLLAAVPPGQDAPPHIVAAAVMSAPDAFADEYTVRWAPAAQAFEALTIGFHSVLPLFWAAKLALIVFASMLCAACGVIARRLGGEPTVAVALAAAYGIGWIPAMGFYNFFAGLALGMAGAALVLRPGCRMFERVPGALLLVAAAWAHIIAAAMVGGFLVAARAIAGDRGGLGKTLAADAATVLPSAAYVGHLFVQTLAAAHDSGRIAGVEASTDRVFAHTFDTTFGGFSSSGWVLALAVLVAATLAERSRRNARVGGLLLVSLVILTAIPLHAIGWHFAKPRPAFFVFVGLPMLLRFRPEGRSATVLVAAAAIAASVSAIGNVREGARIHAAVAQYPDADAGHVLEANFHPEPHVVAGPGIRSGVGIPHYATLGGGTLPGAFATNPQIHSLSFVGGMDRFPNTAFLTMVLHESCREDPACYRSHEWRADLLSVVGVHWDSLALVDPPDAVVERLELRGCERDGWLVRSRSADARVRLPDGLRGPIVWRFGFPETIGVFEDGSANIDEDGVVIRATNIPAGPTRIQVFIDHDRNGELGPGEPVLMDRDETLLADGPTEITIELRR